MIFVSCNLNQLEQTWSDSISANFIWFEPLWTNLIQVDLIWSNLNWFEPIWTNFIWLEPNNSTNNQPNSSWAFLIQFEPICSSLIHFGQIWSNLIQSDEKLFQFATNSIYFTNVVLASLYFTNIAVPNFQRWANKQQTWQRARSLSKIA